jgi:hypothetical protein
VRCVSHASLAMKNATAYLIVLGLLSVFALALLIVHLVS